MVSYKSLSTQYEKGAKKISVRSKRPKVSVKKDTTLEIEKSNGNYDLHFNKDGFLVKSFHFERTPTKIIFAFDKKKRIVKMLQLEQESNILIGTVEYLYDKKDRIKKEIHTNCFHNFEDEVNEWAYTYKKNLQIMLIHSLDEEQEDATFYYHNDLHGRLIEEKGIRNKDELIYWSKFEYDKKGKLIKEISLDANGKQDGLYEFFPQENNQSVGYKYSSADKNYSKEYAYQFNERGHWIHQVVSVDGIPQYFYDRGIEYY